jgi:membrane-bound lytic murein transglycosylase D
VVQGDNLTAIAKKYHVSPLELKAWNHLTDNTIALGSTLIVSKTEIEEVRAKKKDKLTASVKSSQSLYSVKKGDSLFSIAKKHPGITISDIKKWNGIKNEDLKPGMKLKMNG